MFGKGRTRPQAPQAAEEPAPAPPPVLLVTLLDVAEADHPAILARLSEKFGASHKLVFLLSTDDFTPFLRAGAAFETFPSPGQQEQHRRLMDWPGYLAEKWELLLLKWRPGTVISYGSNPDRFLAQARAAAERAGRAG